MREVDVQQLLVVLQHALVIVALTNRLGTTLRLVDDQRLARLRVVSSFSHSA